MYHHHNNYVKNVFTQYININDIRCIFEIGARECRYTNELLQFYNKCGSIHSFECNPYTVIECYKNSQDPRIIFNNIAISDKEGFIDFNTVCTDGDYGFSSEYIPKGHEQNIKDKFKVPCITLDLYANIKNIKQIDLIAIDIEGGELKAFQGATNILKNINHIIVEVSSVQRLGDAPLFDDITTFLKQYNFKRVVYSGNEEIGDCLYTRK